MSRLSSRSMLKVSALLLCLLGGLVLLGVTILSFARSDHLRVGVQLSSGDDAVTPVPPAFRYLHVSFFTGRGTACVDVEYSVRWRSLERFRTWAHGPWFRHNVATTQWRELGWVREEDGTMIGLSQLHYVSVGVWHSFDGDVVFARFPPDESWEGYRLRAIGFPLWLPAGLLLVPPGVAIYRHRRRKPGAFPVIMKQPPTGESPDDPRPPGTFPM